MILQHTSVSTAPASISFTLPLPDGTTTDMTLYNGNQGYGDSVQSYVKQIGKLTSASDIDKYIQSVTPGSKITGQYGNFSGGQKWTSLGNLHGCSLQHELGGFNSSVLQQNNNPAGVTWTQSYQDSHPGTSKGSARPASEGGIMLKFDTLQNGLNEFLTLYLQSNAAQKGKVNMGNLQSGMNQTLEVMTVRVLRKEILLRDY